MVTESVFIYSVVKCLSFTFCCCCCCCELWCNFMKKSRNRNESFWKEEKFCVSSNDEHHKLTRSFVALEYRYNITSTRSARSERARERNKKCAQNRARKIHIGDVGRILSVWAFLYIRGPRWAFGTAVIIRVKTNSRPLPLRTLSHTMKKMVYIVNTKVRCFTIPISARNRIVATID